MHPSNSNTRESGLELLVVTASQRDQLIQRVQQIKAALDGGVAVAHVAAALASQLGPEMVAHEPCRLAIIGTNAEECSQRLDRALQKLADPNCTRIRDGAGIYFVQSPLYEPGRVAFLYPGEGAQFPGMLEGLDTAFPSIRRVVEDCVKIEQQLELELGWLQRCLFAPSEHREKLETLLQDFSFALLTVMTSSWCLTSLLEQLAVRPDVMAGHSAGESTALFASKAICEGTPIGILEAIGDITRVEDDSTAMLAVGAGKQRVTDILTSAGLYETSSQQLYVAMDNCPHQAVVVGMREAIERAQQTLAAQNLVVQSLSIPRPYHTPMFAPYMQPLTELFQRIEFQSPHVPLYSCTSGQPFPADPEQIRQLAIDHWLAPVAFTDMIRNMYESGVRIFIEVGPRGNLSAFTEDILRGQPAAIVPANRLGRSAAAQMYHLAAELTTHNVPLNLKLFYAEPSAYQLPWRSQKQSRFEVASATSQSSPAPSRGPRPVARRQTSSMRRRILDRVQRTQQKASLHQQTILGHQQLMQRFLQNQQQVMAQYLQGQPATTAPNSQLPPGEEAVAFDPSSLPLGGHAIELEAGRRIVIRRPLSLEEDLYADHHTVGGQSISNVDPSQHGLPVMPMTFFIESMAEAAKQLFPQLRVVKVQKVRLRRWLPFYPQDPGEVEVRVEFKQHETEGGIRVTASICDLGASRTAQREGLGGEAAACELVLQQQFNQPTDEQDSWQLTNPRPCPVDCDTLYMNLFHGPVLSGITSIEALGDHEIECIAEVQPREGIFQSNPAPEFLLDPVTMDIATHTLAAWHLAQADQSGRIMLPFEVEEIEFFDEPQAVGKKLICRGEFVAESPRHFVHNITAVKPDGSIWMKWRGAKFWRFYLPFCNVNFHGPKDVYFLSADLSPELCDDVQGRIAVVHLVPPSDLGQGAVLTAAERVIMSPTEQRYHESLEGTSVQKVDRLFELSIVKDAVRRYMLINHGERLFAADIEAKQTAEGVFATFARDGVCQLAYPTVQVTRQGDTLTAAAAECPFAMDVQVRETEQVVADEMESVRWNSACSAASALVPQIKTDLAWATDRFRGSNQEQAFEVQSIVHNDVVVSVAVFGDELSEV